MKFKVDDTVRVKIEEVIPNTVWEHRRYEIAKDIFSAMYLDEGQAARADTSDLGFEYKDAQSMAKEAVEYADALINELNRI